MIHYFLFLIYCISTRFTFFSLPPGDQIILLKKYHLYFEAGYLYKKYKEYEKAIECFEKISAHRHILHCYSKLGRISKATEIAENHHLYKEGATLCLAQRNYRKAAFFYSFYDVRKAITLYKKIYAYFEVGICYMGQYDFINAARAFNKCRNPLHKQKGLSLIKEVALTLYEKKQYAEALTLFIALEEHYYVLDCARTLGNEAIIKSAHFSLATQFVKEGLFLEAAYFIEPYDASKAHLYTILSQTDDMVIKSVLSQKKYYRALNLCFKQNQIDLAESLTNYWINLPEFELAA